MRKIKNLVFLMVLMCISQNVQASDYANSKDPRFVGVKRVFVYVEYHQSFINDEDIPVILHRENIEKTLVDLYQMRFSSNECAQFMKSGIGITPYECNDQPVIAVPMEEASHYMAMRDTSFATKEELKDEGTLHVIFYVNIMGNYSGFEPSLDVPIVTIESYLDRPNSQLPISLKRPNASSFPINQSPEKIQKWISSYVSKR